MSAVIERSRLAERVDLVRLDASRRLDPERKVAFGQFLSPSDLATFMASMLECSQPTVHILDAGAGIGSLFCAAVEALIDRKLPPRAIHVTAYELDDLIIPYLTDTMELCRQACSVRGVDFTGEVIQSDFIADAVSYLEPTFFRKGSKPGFTCAILNPPYLKINSQSEARGLLRRVGIETSNMYTAFLALAARLLEPEGELVAITPRSFCNGPYFRPFRQDLLDQMSLRRLHLFDSRQQAFRDDAVLQENVILSAVKAHDHVNPIVISSNSGPTDEVVTWREVDYQDVVHPSDPQSFIRILQDELSQQVADQMAHFQTPLTGLGLTVSTGRVVDFRAKEYLRATSEPGTAPLIYPSHFSGCNISWPKIGGRKPNAIADCPQTQGLFIPVDHYVLVKRFSSKEEKKRIVAAVLRPEDVTGNVVGIENHLNYFHHNGRGLDASIARGLSVFLNSSLVDAYFRQFNGHTQVNATDLRSLGYPTEQELQEFGEWAGAGTPDQSAIDAFLATRFTKMAEDQRPNLFEARRRIEETSSILKILGFPKPQQNERSALSLLALLDLRPEQDWQEASDPLRGITQMMDFFAEHYGKQYAPNSRETVRRQTVHQFLEAGLIVINPDEPERPTNSGKTVYQIEASAFKLLRSFGTDDWGHDLEAYLASRETLQSVYAQARAMTRIPVVINGDTELTLSAGGQNVLVQQIIEQFAERFTPGGTLVYVGDTDEKFAYYDTATLSELGVVIESHGKMPDVIIYYGERNWLVLVEAVTSHGPVNPKRRTELEQLFAGSTAGLVMVTAFLNRKALAAYLDDISWETEVWVADHASHLIHFNGERFLGPY